MPFNSIDFAVFLPVVFIFYWFITNKNLKIQNLFIVIASYIFYGWWNWKFLPLLILSSLVDYSVARGLTKVNDLIKRRVLLCVSITFNLGLLGFFKYFNFFIANFVSAFSFFGYPIQANTLNIILPVGISFYTFQTLSYVIDVYKRKLEPTKDLVTFLAFVSFFPQLVAGPIERATHLLPQFLNTRKFSYTQAVDGLRQILWGLFKKIVIADNCAVYANMIFNNSSNYSGSTLVIGALFFTFQIYGDFSGYSDIAIGTARLFGFNLIQNFNFPYFSRDIAEFWRRWHISLSTWFRDYIYIPLGGSRGGTIKTVCNTFIIFVVCGFWHGANWTFIVWGALNAIYFLPLLLRKRNRQNFGIVAEGKLVPSLKEAVEMVVTFSLTVFAWIFFRASNISHAFSYILEIFSKSLFTIPDFPARRQAFFTFITIIIFLLIEWIGRDNQYAIEKIGIRWNRTLKWAFYYSIIISIILLQGYEQPFIYFQF